MKVLFIYTNINGFHQDSYGDGIAQIMAVTKRGGHDLRQLQVFNKNEYDDSIFLPNTCELIITAGKDGAVWRGESFPAVKSEIDDLEIYWENLQYLRCLFQAHHSSNFLIMNFLKLP